MISAESLNIDLVKIQVAYSSKNLTLYSLAILIVVRIRIASEYTIGSDFSD